MRGSFLEYAYSVIYARALPDARDGLKPVQRRILFQMAQMGLRPDRGHVKSARVVGEVMGRLHPHGDSAIYDALVRMAQPFTLRLPMVDGHGNFGSLDDGPAAMRYTEARLAEPRDGHDRRASTRTSSTSRPNYDGRETEPAVLPAAIPNLLVNGASGIAVGMATNLVPHNLGEVLNGARHLLHHPEATLAEIMTLIPGPDFPGGGVIIGLDGVRDAYETGRGSFRVRARTRVEQITPRRRGIVVTELPFNVGPERIIDRIKDAVQSKKLQGISDVVDLTDGDSGLQLVIEVKNGFHPEAVLEHLFKLTPMEDTVNVNAVALVDGQPQTMGLLPDAARLARPPAHRRAASQCLPPRQGRGPPPPRRGPARGHPRHRRGHPADPRVRRRRGREGPAHVGLRPQRRPGHLHPGHAAASPHASFSRIELEKEGDDLRRDIDQPDRAPRGRRRPACGRRRRALRGRPGARHAASHPAHGGLGGARSPPPSRSRCTTSPAWCCCPAPACSPARPTRAPPPRTPTTSDPTHDVIISAIPATSRGEFGLVTSAGRVHPAAGHRPAGDAGRVGRPGPLRWSAAGRLRRPAAVGDRRCA